MSPWEKRLAQDRKEIFAEIKRMREEAMERKMPELIARLEKECPHVVDARIRPGKVRRPPNWFIELLRDFMASPDAVWGIVPGDGEAARHFAIRMCRVMRQQKTEARIRRKGALIYLERIG